MKRILFLIICISIFFTGCTINIHDNNDGDDDNIRGRGDLISHNIALPHFSGVSIIGQADVDISYGAEQSIIVRAQDNIYNVLDIHVSDGVMIIGVEEGCSISTDKGIFIDIVTPDVIDYLSITGAGDINIAGNRQSLLDIDITGAGNVQAFSLPVSTSRINISGAGNCDVNVSERLEVTISGTGSVKYKGQPRVSQYIAGLGSVSEEN